MTFIATLCVVYILSPYLFFFLSFHLFLNVQTSSKFNLTYLLCGHILIAAVKWDAYIPPPFTPTKSKKNVISTNLVLFHRFTVKCSKNLLTICHGFFLLYEYYFANIPSLFSKKSTFHVDNDTLIQLTAFYPRLNYLKADDWVCQNLAGTKPQQQKSRKLPSTE